MKEKIDVRQICFIMLAYTAASKLLTYPSTLADLCGRDLLFPALINFFIQGIAVWAAVYLCSRTDKTFFELLCDNIGKVGAQTVMGFFAAFFMLCTIIPIFEQKLYVHAIFYDTVPPLIVFLPFFFFSVYVGGKGFKNIGRCADICLPLFIATLALLFAMGFCALDLTNLLPLGKAGAGKIFGGARGTAYMFAEPAYILMFMGRFKYKKGDAAKITLSYAAGAVFVLAFLAFFYGVYGDIAASRQFPVSKISLFCSAIDVLGRIDLIALYVLEIVMLFALALNIQLAVWCLAQCTGFKNTGLISLAVNIALATVLILFEHSFFSITEVFARWMWIVFIIFATAIPFAVWLLRRER